MNLFSQLALLWLRGWTTCSEYWLFTCTSGKTNWNSTRVQPTSWGGLCKSGLWCLL